MIQRLLETNYGSLIRISSEGKQFSSSSIISVIVIALTLLLLALARNAVHAYSNQKADFFKKTNLQAVECVFQGAFIPACVLYEHPSACYYCYMVLVPADANGARSLQLVMGTLRTDNVLLN